MKTGLLVVLAVAGTASWQADALAAEQSVAVGRPSIFWHNGEWQAYKDGVWTPYCRTVERSEMQGAAMRSEAGTDQVQRSPGNPEGVAASAGAIGERNVQLGQPTIGIGKNNTGISQNPIGIGRNNTGIGPNNTGIGQTTIGIGRNNTGVGQTTIGMGQNSTGIGQTTIGIGKPTTGIGERNGMGQTTIGIGKQTEFQKPKHDSRPRAEKNER